MAVKQPQRGAPSGAGVPRRWTRLATFVAPHLQPEEKVLAILTKTGEPGWLIGLLSSFASFVSPAFIGLGDIFATHRAIVVSDRHVLIVRMPWLRAWSIEQVSARASVAVTGFASGSLPAGGLLFTPGSISLRFSENSLRFSEKGQQIFRFGVDGGDLRVLQAEAEAVVSALTPTPMPGDLPARRAT